MTTSDALALNETLLSETNRSYRTLGVELGPSDAVKNTHALAAARLRYLSDGESIGTTPGMIVGEHCIVVQSLLMTIFGNIRMAIFRRRLTRWFTPTWLIR